MLCCLGQDESKVSLNTFEEEPPIGWNNYKIVGKGEARERLESVRRTRKRSRNSS